jgi:hypothetical protein
MAVALIMAVVQLARCTTLFGPMQAHGDLILYNVRTFTRLSYPVH